MKAANVKVAGALLATLERTKPAKQSLATYVRSLLERALRQEQLVAAADRYAEFLREDPEERGRLSEWERADLALSVPSSRASAKRGTHGLTS